MFPLNEHLQKAIEAFESEDPQSMDLFYTNAIPVYNHFAQFPDELGSIDNPYLIGIVYSYLEGALRDTNMADACYEKACYCFAKVMTTESNYEKQCAAMRLFLLMNDNGMSAFELCCKAFEKSCLEIEGVFYEEFKVKAGLRLQKYLNYIESCIKQYVYSLFVKAQNHSYISVQDMARVRMYINYGNYENFVETPYSLGPKFYFEMFYQYLKEIMNHSILHAMPINMRDIDNVDE